MTALDRETLAAAVDAAMDGWAKVRYKAGPPGQNAAPRLHEFVADALLAGPLAPPPSGGEADEAAARLAAYLDARVRVGQDRLTDTLSHVREGEVYSVLSVSDLRLLLDDRERLAFEAAGCRQALRDALDTQDVLCQERDENLDPAFRAAFAPEEGASVQFAAQMPNGVIAFHCRTERGVRNLAPPGWPVVHRTVGPWKPLTAESGGEL